MFTKEKMSHMFGESFMWEGASIPDSGTAKQKRLEYSKHFPDSMILAPIYTAHDVLDSLYLYEFKRIQSGKMFHFWLDGQRYVVRNDSLLKTYSSILATSAIESTWVRINPCEAHYVPDSRTMMQLLLNSL